MYIEGEIVKMNAVKELENLLQAVPQKIREFTGDELARPISEGKWSRLQLLGHLCDSAINNLSRFIQLQYQQEPLLIIPYKCVFKKAVFQNREGWMNLRNEDTERRQNLREYRSYRMNSRFDVE
ncbi:hypothetical protein [Paenibacillus sp. MBLB4367]|uniref:hypothetical protein n=1 Tax=Paenibacillus sp. MBLB4367 TaxID=3384767 RepID=UPI003907ECAD